MDARFNVRAEERFYERAVKKKVSPRPPKFLAASTQLTRSDATLIALLLMTVFLFAFA